MIDEGETDWKIFCIDVNDPLAKDMNGKDELLSIYKKPYVNMRRLI